MRFFAGAGVGLATTVCCTASLLVSVSKLKNTVGDGSRDDLGGWTATASLADPRYAARRSLARMYTAAELAMRPMKRGSLAIRRAMPQSTSGRE